MPEICICIASYRRPEGVDHLLRSLAGLAQGTPEFGTIVVDNDPNRSAEKIVRRAANEGMTVRYLCEPDTNISKARNCGVRAAESKFVAFIDDDETADSNWLLNLHRGLIAEEADAAFGPVISRFAATPPRWIEDLGFFVDRTPPTGTKVAWHDARTSNALVRSSALEGLSQLFDEELGSLGGEDVDLFARMADSGGRLISVEDAIVYEAIETARLTRRWMVRRYMHNGIIQQYIKRRYQSKAERKAFVRQAFKKIWGSLGRALVGTATSRRQRVRELFAAMEHLGVVAGALGLRMRQYGQSG